MPVVDVGNDFYHRLANRDEHQGDGSFNAVQFREKYLSKLDSKEEMNNCGEFITLDFKNVKKIGPSFANEAFAYFAKYGSPEQILDKIKFINITEVQLSIIKLELDSGYNR